MTTDAGAPLHQRRPHHDRRPTASRGHRRRSYAALLLAMVLGAAVLAPASPSIAARPEQRAVGAAVLSQSDSGSPTQIGSSGTCSAYANGNGMGSYCAHGGTASKTLRERFGGATFQMCRFTDPPAGLPVPANLNPGQGRWLLRTCLTHIDYDTYSGGKDRRLNIGLVFVDNGFDTAYQENDLSRFLWQQFESTAQFPVPFVQNQPRLVPVVNSPTFFTFRWIDPKSKQPVSQGQYRDNPDGGPFVRLENQGGLVMRAQATDIVVSPEQSDMKAVDCGGTNPTYDLNRPPDPRLQPSQCYLTFDRSSATSRAKTTHEIPNSLGDVYYASVTVTWKVTYGPDDQHQTQLGDGFKMVLMQPLLVQEVQAPNLPPVAIF